MSSSYFKLSKSLQTRLQQELQPGESVTWAGSPNWRASPGNLVSIGLFGLGWTAFTGFFTAMIGAAVIGFVPFKMNGRPASGGWAIFFLALMVPFIAIGGAMLLHAYRELRSGSRRVHAVTGKRILTVEIGRKKPIDDKPRSSINFVKSTERADGSGTIEIAVGVERDVEGSPRPETLKWPGIPDVAFVQATLDRRSPVSVSATQRAPEQTVVPAAFADLPAHLARAAERETRGERIEWIGRPDARTAAKWSMLVWIFALPWLYFTVRWELTSLGMLTTEMARAKTNDLPVFSLVFALWGLPFIFVGLSMLATPLWVYRKAKATAYIITDRRILSIGRQRSKITVANIEPSRIVSVTRTDFSGGGNIKILLGKTIDSDGDETDLTETLWLVENAARAEHLIEALCHASDGRKRSA